jgi:general secretion pathway protein D
MNKYLSILLTTVYIGSIGVVNANQSESMATSLNQAKTQQLSYSHNTESHINNNSSQYKHTGKILTNNTLQHELTNNESNNLPSYHRFNSAPNYNSYNFNNTNYHNNTQNNYNSATDKNTQNSPRLPANKVMLNFDNADIVSVIKSISKLSGRNFVIDPRVKGTINIVSDQPINKTDSYKVLETALRMQGFATVENNGVINVIPEPEAKSYGMQTYTNNNSQTSEYGNQIITKIFVIQNGLATQIATAIRPFVSNNNIVSVYPVNNTIVVSDYSNNMTRITKIINKLTSISTTSLDKPLVITLQNSIAGDIAQTLRSFVGSSGSSNTSGTEGPSVNISIDPDSNSLILTSGSTSKLQELQELALALDKRALQNENYFHVVYLKNADAYHVADVLNAVVSGQPNVNLTATSSQSKFAQEPGSVFSSGGGSSGGTGIGSSTGSSAQNNTTSNSANSANDKDHAKVFIQAEPTTNSLIIRAPTTIYRNLLSIIKMLDIRRAQIMIEAMIAQVNTTQSGTFGVQWLVGGGNNNVGAFGVANYGQNGNSLSNLATNAALANGGGSAPAAPSIPGEVYVGLVTGTTSVGGQTIPSLGALADMITANSVGNILSRPTMITLDNETARIMVGSNIGIPNGSFTATAGQAGNLTTTITRQDLGTVLQIKPLITQSGAIQLDVWQENSLLDPNQPINSLQNGPSFLKRNMRATLLVDDGQIIALGGMTEDSISIIQNGVPGLSKIPYLGWLFSWQSRTHSKTNLVLFLRPVIIKNADGAKALTNQRYDYIIRQQENVQATGNAVLPTITPVTLENQMPYNNQSSLPQNNESITQAQQQTNDGVIDLTNQGKNINNSSTQAIKVTTTKYHANDSQTVVTPNQ